MRVGKFYKGEKVEGSWDAIVIGSGMSGLCTASLLSRKGQKVLIVEKHYVAGGFTHVFKRTGYEWDVGLHYIGEVNVKGSIMQKLFDFITDAKLKWAPMDDVYDRIVFGDEQFDLVSGKKNLKQKLKAYFPSEEDQISIDKYFELVGNYIKSADSYYAEKALPPIVGKIAGPFMRRKMLKFADKTTLETLKEITGNSKLIAVLTGQYGDYGLPPGQSSFAMHATVANHYFEGAVYPVGGSSNIARTIEPSIKKGGGEILLRAGVDEIIVENGKAAGVKLHDGQEIYAKKIISSAGIENTYKYLLPEKIREKHNLNGLLSGVQSSVGHVCLYVGIAKPAEELNLEKTNYWIYPRGFDHDDSFNSFLKDKDSEFPVVYISFPSIKDPDWENRFPGKTTIEIITLADYNWFSKWEDKRWKKRGEDYEELKEKFSQKLLTHLYKTLPHLEGKIDYYELSTPLSTKHFCNYKNGEIYGLANTPQRFRQKFLRVHTPVKNLYLTGQDILTAGIGGALISGVITVSGILRKNILLEIMKS